MAAIMFSLFAQGVSYGQNSDDAVAARVANVTSRFDGPDWKVRGDAFYALFEIIVPGGLLGTRGPIKPAMDAFFKAHPETKSQIAVDLSHLLQRENDVLHNANDLPEDFGQYHGDLVRAVAALNDPAATDALLGAIATGNMAARGLAAQPGASLDRVIAMLNSVDVGERIGASNTLGHLLDSRLDAAQRARAKAGLLRAAKDPHFAVRESAVPGLAKMSDPDVRALLAEIAAKDSYRTPDGKYRVRDAARRAIAQH